MTTDFEKPAAYAADGDARTNLAALVEEVRRVYEKTNEPVSSIERRFGFTKHRLNQLRLARGWACRPQVAKPGPLQGRRPEYESFAGRLDNLIAIGIAVHERQVLEEGMTEAHARTLRELWRALEISMRAKRNEKAAKAREKKNDDAARDFRDDPDWLIAEVNRRLDRLAEAGGSGSGEASATSRGDEATGSIA